MYVLCLNIRQRGHKEGTPVVVEGKKGGRVFALNMFRLSPQFQLKRIIIQGCHVSSTRADRINFNFVETVCYKRKENKNLAIFWSFLM